jgi:hypothetical protein
VGKWDLGWEALVAAGTFTLAWFTWRLARQTRSLAVETAREVRSVSRPVLIDPAGAVARMEVGGGADRTYGGLSFAIRNAGGGPALNTYAYAISTTRAGDVQTTLANVGNVAPEEETTVQLGSVTNVDTSGEMDTFLAVRVIMGYSDLAGARYYTVVRLSDPEEGSKRDGTMRWDDLKSEGTTVGEGALPPQQWRVTFRGRDLSEDDKQRLRGSAIHYTGGHGIPGGAWSSSVFLFADDSEEAIRLVRTELGGDRAPFGGWVAQPWATDPLVFREPPRLSQAVDVARRVLRRIRP